MQLCAFHRFPRYCHSLNQNGYWIKDQTATVTPGRDGSGTVVIQNKLYMVGGFGNDGRSRSIMALKPNTTTRILNVYLPYDLENSCVVPWNEKTMLVTGGYNFKGYQKGTFFVNIETETITPGPDMQKRRSSHGCQEFLFQGHPYIIVGGGYGTKSTEVLDKNNVGQGWTKGKQK